MTGPVLEWAASGRPHLAAAQGGGSSSVGRAVRLRARKDWAARIDPARRAVSAQTESGCSEVKARSRSIRRPKGRRMASIRSEEHTSELQSLMRISYAVICLKKKNR